MQTAIEGQIKKRDGDHQREAADDNAVFDDWTHRRNEAMKH
jgi:hypothetical protein